MLHIFRFFQKVCSLEKCMAKDLRLLKLRLSFGNRRNVICVTYIEKIVSILV